MSTTDETQVPHIPEIPDFDAKAMHRAVRRGVLWTAFDVIALLVLASLLGQFVLAGLQGLGNRDDNFRTVVGTGYLVAHPEYAGDAGCCNYSLTTMSVYDSIDLRSPQGVPLSRTVFIAQNLRGHVLQETVPHVETALGDVVQSGPGLADSSSRVLDGLPSNLQASGVVWFTHPVDQAGVDAAVGNLGITLIGGPTTSAGVLFPAARVANSVHTIVGWPTSSIQEYRGWAGGLTSSDLPGLSAVGLPDAAHLQAAGRPGAVGVVFGAVPVSVLKQIAHKPNVRGVVVADVTFDLGLTNAAQSS